MKIALVMPRSTRKNIAGQRFGRLFVASYSHTGKDGQAHWICKCDCGNTTTVRGGILRRGKTSSCGCLRIEAAKNTHSKYHKIIDGNEVKECSSCKKWLLLMSFSKSIGRRDGLQHKCNSCKSIRQKNDRPRFMERVRSWANRQYKSNDYYKIKSCIRSRIRQALKNNYKAVGTTDLIGCSIENLRLHLESMFDENMNWENYGKYWHIDHIVPCSRFDLSDSEQQKACFRYTNLQPLPAIENLRKGNRI